MTDDTSLDEALALRERVVLQLDLAAGRVLRASGYAPSNTLPAVPGVALARSQDIGEWTFFLRAIPYRLAGSRACDVASWLRSFQPEDIALWAAKFDGPFSLVAWSVDRQVAHVVSDRIGAQRLYVNVHGDLVTVTDHLLDQVRHQRAPRFDPVGTHVLLTFQYCLDPISVLADTPVVVLGRTAKCSPHRYVLDRYHHPVTNPLERYKDLGECLEAIDNAMRATITTYLTNAVPLVMVSGGIDSLVLMRYIGEHTGGRFESMTFAIEGSANNELREGALAAQYYGSTHHELLIPQEQILEYAKRALVEGDVAGYGGVEHVALADLFRGDGRRLGVLRGEDTRLHTPPIDGPTRLALRAHLLRVQDRPQAYAAWELRQVLSRWPFRRGANYARYVLAKTDLGPDINSYILRSLLRFNDPVPSDGRRASVPTPVASRLASMSPYTSLEAVVRATISVAYDLQYTDDMHAVQSAIGMGDANLIMPFYSPSVVEATARVPFAMATRVRLVSPRRTGSPFPLADKYILRELMRHHAPNELLYRRKATAPAMDVQLPILYPKLIRPALERWGERLLQALTGPARAIAEVCRIETLHNGVAANNDFASGATALRLLYLTALTWQMDHPRGDLLAALEGLSRPPE